MADHYELTTDIDDLVEDLIENDEDHSHLKLSGVTIGVLYFTGNGPLKCKGWPCHAYVKKTSTRDRAMGVRDAIIVVDKEGWEDMEDDKRRALIDHELYHLIPITDGTKLDGEGDGAKVVPVFEYDSLHRPKLRLRPHDVEVGWFIRMAQKHGAASIECEQAAAIFDKHGQTLFAFAGDGNGGGASKAAKKFVDAVKKSGSKVTVTSGDTSVTFGGEQK